MSHNSFGPVLALDYITLLSRRSNIWRLPHTAQKQKHTTALSIERPSNYGTTTNPELRYKSFRAD